MYRVIVARKVRQAWAQLERRDPDGVLRQLADRFEHTFVGDHALGGTRHTSAAQVEWFGRLFRLLPDVHFTVRDVLVAGWPWDTRVHSVIDVSLDAEPGYRNVVAQQLRLRWGRITRISNLEDTQALAELLARRAAQGDPEALAPAISDDDDPHR